MSIGTYLVGIAILLLIAAYIGNPFRRVKVDVDSFIEQWVSDARNNLTEDELLTGEDALLTSEESTEEVVILTGAGLEVFDTESVNFCPHCGRRVEDSHRFCPGCGTQLVKGAAQ